jgi:hypothetical protein
MAVFKLGRIRFIWKSNWVTATAYVADDVIRYGGKTYICVVNHTADANFYNDLTALYWQEMNSGVDWTGSWATSTFYKINDIVKYGGKVYICNTGHTSAATASLGLENDSASWDLFSDGFDYKATWATSTRYKVNDIVKYGGVIYLCNTDHTSAATASLGLEDDQASWDVFHQGVDYKGDWAITTRYKLNDLVKDGGTIYICITPHTSSNAASIETDQANWNVFVQGLEFEDSWSGATAYQIGDLVTYGGYTYVAKTNNTGQNPAQNASDWDVFATGFNYQGAYNNGTAYRVGDIVSVGGWTYLCKLDSTGNRPPNGTYWDKLNEGFEWNNTWANSTFYDAGDAIFYSNNSYVCILAHTSDNSDPGAANRPDQTNGSTYWNLVAAGGEESALTTKGDLVTYGDVGVERLPIGTAGQVLQVDSTGTVVEWDYFGKTEYVYYVESNSGANDPAPFAGKSINRPWQSIRYGLEQIENGAEFYNAKHLLQVNRSFIQAEVVEWIDYQIANVISPFTGGFSYNKELCRRDTGIIVDALIYDITHGGNTRTREAALAYYTEAGASYISGQETETAAAIAYSLEVIEAVLDNAAPAANYQTLNGVGSPITQVINSDFVEEPTALSLITSLTAIVTDAITAGNINSVPNEVIATKTLFVKTGTFTEVLPMIIPKNTAVVGDELRSTRITAAGVVATAGDVTESVGALSRLQTIMSDIIQNNAVTPTTGNSESQVTTRPAGSAGAATVATDLVQQISDFIEYRVDGAAGDSTIPLVSGTNDPETSTGYTYAVETLRANRAFIIAEITAYIADTYPGLSYTVASCERDISRYIDAIAYDLIYTGNYKSIMAARLYANAVLGSTTEDMFYVQNGTGLRNCTVNGLAGTLSISNEYGTKRPSAGAYVSLDPGRGPDDSSVWITTRSPYVQNVTTFGVGCIGLKIDGSLHNGGNDSVVANDFTQLVSDGIGVWCTNLARAELVSVFSYYAHIGYLAENGGKIRATNGNSSYGTYGTVAEGIDATEIPISGTVDNRATEAQISRVITDDNNILVFEYSNAGQGYTTTTTAVKTVDSVSALSASRTPGTYRGLTGTTSGSGTGQEFDITINDAGAAEVVTVVKGGTGHVVDDTFTISDSDLGGGGAPNLTFDVATIGDATVYDISGDGFGADVANSVVVNGGVHEVRLLNTGGNIGGAGYITATNVAQSGNTTQLFIAQTDENSSAAYIGMAIWIISGTGSGQYAYIDTYNAATKLATVRKYSDGTPGWDHITGLSIEATLDGTTEYVIEPRLTFGVGPTTTAIGRARVADDRIVEITIIDPGEGYVSAPSLTITDPNNTIEAPVDVRFGNGVLAQPTWTNRGTDYETAGATVSGDGYADSYQPGLNIFVRDLTAIPQEGANVEFGDISGKVYKLVTVRSLLGNGPYSAQLQISPTIGVDEAPEHLDDVTIRIRYSQVRLTGHDFLEVGTGNQIDTNYPNEPIGTNVAFPSEDLTIAGNWSVNNTTISTNVIIAPDGTLTADKVVEDSSNSAHLSRYTHRQGPGTYTVSIFAKAAERDEFTFLCLDSGAATYHSGIFNLATGTVTTGGQGLAGSSSIVEVSDGWYRCSVTFTQTIGLSNSYFDFRLSDGSPGNAGDVYLGDGTSGIYFWGAQVEESSFATSYLKTTNAPVSRTAQSDLETNDFGGGRVFYTSTDQDGNFRVGGLFNVEQSTGVATLNVESFNISGLNELQIGEIELGGSGVVITEFSTDGTFAANSDNIVPTQKAIKTYITSQIGGGSATLNVNSITAGQVKISSNVIELTSGSTLLINTNVEFTGQVSGAPLALGFFLTS